MKTTISRYTIRAAACSMLLGMFAAAQTTNTPAPNNKAQQTQYKNMAKDQKAQEKAHKTQAKADKQQQKALEAQRKAAKKDASIAPAPQ